MQPNNPFLISGYYSPRYFCDRHKETQTMIEALHNGRNTTLIAPRRMGKTGLIKNVFYLLQQQQPDIITLYMDIYSTQNLGDFVQLLAGTVLGKLDTAPQKALARVSRFIRSCRPVFTLDEHTGVPKISIDMVPSATEATLKEIFDYLQSADKRCYIAIDEFQQIGQYPERGVEALLRSYIQFVPNINFVFAGSQQHIIQEMFLSAKRPFYQSTQTLSIDGIDPALYYPFAAAFFAEQQRHLDQPTFDYLYHRFGGYTWYIQVMLNRLYSYTHPINRQLVDYAIDEVVAESVYSYQSLLAAYPSSHVRLLKAVANEGCVREINSGQFIGKYKLKAASSVNSALKKLLQNELIYKTPEGYMVYDRLMAIWLRSSPF